MTQNKNIALSSSGMPYTRETELGDGCARMGEGGSINWPRIVCPAASIVKWVLWEQVKAMVIEFVSMPTHQS